MSTAGLNAPTAPAPAATGPALLSVRGVKTYYGNIIALEGVDMDVREGEIVTLIGANGAGKSTLMMTIFGNPRAREGAITYQGRDITRLPTHEIARMSIAQSPEGRRIFPRMTVFENLQMGASINGLAHFSQDLERVCGLFPRLKERLYQRGGTLSGGEQQMLAIARVAGAARGGAAASRVLAHDLCEWRRDRAGQMRPFASFLPRSDWRKFRGPRAREPGHGTQSGAAASRESKRRRTRCCPVLVAAVPISRGAS
jgi:ABC-type transport system involved in cytochrome c biogenesis ATPase subunit